MLSSKTQLLYTHALDKVNVSYYMYLAIDKWKDTIFLFADENGDHCKETVRDRLFVVTFEYQSTFYI